MLVRHGIVVGGIALLSVGGSFALAERSPPEQSPRGAFPAVGSEDASKLVTARKAKAAEDRFLGVILARESVDVAARHEGRITAVHVRIGDPVPQGGHIASLDVRTLRLDLDMAAADLRVAQAERDKAGVELAQTEERLARKEKLSAEALVSGEELSTALYQKKLAGVRVAVTEAELSRKRARVEQLRQTREDADIRAPFAGVVAGRYVDPGANVTPETPIVRLNSMDELFVRFAVPEPKRARLRVGLRVLIEVGEGAAEGSVPAGSTALVHGTIEKIAPEVDAASRMVLVESKLDLTSDAKSRLYSGAIARVSVADDEP
ncbi:MAG TPA: efflux RND transporter periplasmic adaptor subunit [Polyangiaceae bacterium]|jgi:RND family efflux transporter MFP subunit|nr:efflux RND transporter periplasmic adaptor subunit [Polyangiaceae bacterium]